MWEVRIETEIRLQVRYGCDFAEFNVTRCYSINICVDMSCWIVASCDKICKKYRHNFYLHCKIECGFSLHPVKRKC